MQVKVGCELRVAASDYCGESEDVPFVVAEGLGGEVGFDGGEEGESFFFGGVGEGHCLCRLMGSEVQGREEVVGVQCKMTLEIESDVAR